MEPVGSCSRLCKNITSPSKSCKFKNCTACLAMLQEVIAAAEEATEEKNEMEELKQLLPDIREKVEDAKESQRTGSAASQAIQQTLVSTQTDRCFKG